MIKWIFAICKNTVKPKKRRMSPCILGFFSVSKVETNLEPAKILEGLGPLCPSLPLPTSANVRRTRSTFDEHVQQTCCHHV